MKSILVIGCLLIALLGCDKGIDGSKNYHNNYGSDYSKDSVFKFNDTIDLAYGKCFSDIERQGSICFDSVLTDSRCPVNVQCIWAGEAVVRFKFTSKNNSSIFIDIHTGTVDTVVNGYKLSFIDLLPYPTTERVTKVEDYKARIIVKKN